MLLGKAVFIERKTRSQNPIRKKISEFRKRTSVGNSFKKLACEGDTVVPNRGKVLGIGRHLLLVLK